MKSPIEFECIGCPSLSAALNTMKRSFEGTSYPSLKAATARPLQNTSLGDISDNHIDDISEVNVVHAPDKVNADRLVEALSQVETHRSALKFAADTIARLTDEASESQQKNQELQNQLQAMEIRAKASEKAYLLSQQEFFVFQTKAVQQMKHLKDVVRVSQEAFENAVADAARKQSQPNQKTIETLQNKLREQELAREEEKQELLKEMWELQQNDQPSESKQNAKKMQKLPVPLLSKVKAAIPPGSPPPERQQSLAQRLKEMKERKIANQSKQNGSQGPKTAFPAGLSAGFAGSVSIPRDTQTLPSTMVS